MNSSSYCITHKRNCFAVSHSSSACRRGTPSSELDVDDTETESDDNKNEAPDFHAEGEQQTHPMNEIPQTSAHKQDQPVRPGMLIADHFVPSHIQNHRIVRGGRTAAQIQFQVEWKNGWTADKSLAQKVIRKHESENMWFVQYRSSWEPYSEYYDTITPDMINTYRNDKGIELFGSGFDEQIEALSKKQRLSLTAEDVYDQYQFEYQEVSEDQCGSDEQADPPLKKRLGRPKKDKLPKQRRALNERNPDCGCSLDCRTSFNRSSRERIQTEFQALPAFASRSTWISNLVELIPCPFRGAALQLRSKKPKVYTARYAFVKRGRVRVRKQFFQAVIAIGNTALSNLNDDNFRHRDSCWCNVSTIEVVTLQSMLPVKRKLRHSKGTS